MSRPCGDDVPFGTRDETAGSVVVTAVWVMLPTYLPNSVAVLVGGGRPIDGGRTWHGTRLLGDGKTWRGAGGGFLAGALLALVLNRIGATRSAALPVFPRRAAVTLPAGAMLGDIGGSFLKRRLGRERGAPVPVLDQLGFAVGALVLTRALAPAWFRSTFTDSVLVATVVLTPVLHVLSNVAAYLVGVKGVPW